MPVFLLILSIILEKLDQIERLLAENILESDVKVDVHKHVLSSEDPEENVVITQVRRLDSC